MSSGESPLGRDVRPVARPKKDAAGLEAQTVANQQAAGSVACVTYQTGGVAAARSSC